MASSAYVRYQIHTEFTPNTVDHPDRFVVKVDRFGLARLLLTEIIHQRGNMQVVTSRPCMYGVFSGPIGGFAPRPKYCVGCLRCIVQYPEMVKVLPNPARLELGDSYFDPEKVDTVLYEAATGHVPVKGAGYRGRMSGDGWDRMWTDMSEIVRPTRDGIHGREYISTSVDIGEKRTMLEFDADGFLVSQPLRFISLPVPFIIDRMPRSVESADLYQVLIEASDRVKTLSIIPARFLSSLKSSRRLVPLVGPGELGSLLASKSHYALLELQGWDPDAYQALKNRFPQTIIAVRSASLGELATAVEHGARVLHISADYHGDLGSAFIQDAAMEFHRRLIDQGIREVVSIIGSGGIIQAEHVPKAIISGFDLVALDTPLLLALQGQFIDEVKNVGDSEIRLPKFEAEWAAQRIQNLFGSWRDQLLEVLGAMGLREVRRLRGELGRAMFKQDLEREAFADISGFSPGE